MSLQYLKKEVRDEVYFLYQSINLKVDFNNLGVKISYKAILSLLIGMIKHSQSTQSNKFTIFLQYREEFIFCMQMNIKKFLKVSIVILDGSRQICPKYSKKKVGNIFAIYYEKSVGTALVLYFDAKYWDILRRSSHVCYYLLNVSHECGIDLKQQNLKIIEVATNKSITSVIRLIQDTVKFEVYLWLKCKSTKNMHEKEYHKNKHSTRTFREAKNYLNKAMKLLKQGIKNWKWAMVWFTVMFEAWSLLVHGVYNSRVSTIWCKFRKFAEQFGR